MPCPCWQNMNEPRLFAVAKSAMFCDTLFCFSRVAGHHLHKYAISSWRTSKGQAVDRKPETHGGDEKDWGHARLQTRTSGVTLYRRTSHEAGYEKWSTV